MASHTPDHSAAPGHVLPEETLPSYEAANETGDLSTDGVGTQVRDDGRVDILINDIDQRLATQIQQIQLAANQEQAESPNTAPLPAYSSRPPPSLNIVIQVVGSRGDVQPFVALGRELKNHYGHRIRLATHGTFKKFVEENGLEFFDIGGDPAELMAFMVKNPGLIPGIKSLKDGDVGKRQKGMAEILEGCWKSCADVDEVQEDYNSTFLPKKCVTRRKPFVANAIIANPPSFAHIHCAQKLGIPLHLMFTMPWSATKSFPHPLANIKSNNSNGSMTNEMSYTIVEMMTWQGLGSLTNKFRTETLGLGKLTQAAGTTMLHRLKIPYTYCWSPSLIPKPKDWGPHISLSGFFFLSLASNYEPDADLAAFLATGPPPVYIGFGSIVVDDPNVMTEMIFDAVKLTGQRALVSKGWGGLGGDALTNKPDGVFMLGNCPHDWLFQHVSAVVHHGGAGTMSAGIALGKPTVIVPFFGDQPFWGAMVARAGAGPLPVPFKELTAAKLAESILEALKPETLERAKELGEKIREERGCPSGAESFHANLDSEYLRCMMVDDKVAVWRLKTNGPKQGDVRLSAFAATVLGDAQLIDINKLRPYRPCEYAVEELDMASNIQSANPVLSTVGSFASGIIHLPINIAKAYAGLVYEPYKGARKDGWRGFGKGLSKGFGGWLFSRRGIWINGKQYGMHAIYNDIKKHLGSGTISYILAANFAQGFEEMKESTEEQRQDILRRWHELAPDLKLVKSEGSMSGSSFSLSRFTSGSSSSSERKGKENASVAVTAVKLSGDPGPSTGPST